MLEYLKDRNATNAYMRAYGVKQSTADNCGPRMLGNARVRAVIDAAEAALIASVQEATGVTLERTVRAIALAAFGDARRFFDEAGNLMHPPSLPDDAAALMAGFEVFEEFEGKGEDRQFVGHTKKVKIADRAKYLDMLMKHLGGYKADNEQGAAVLRGALGDLFAGLHSGAGRARPVK